MCLRTNKEKLNVAENDITVYKIVNVFPVYIDRINFIDFSIPVREHLLSYPEYHGYSTFFRCEKIGGNCIENRYPYKAVGYAMRLGNLHNSCDYKYQYSSGLIHSFGNENDAVSYLLQLHDEGETDAGEYAIVYRCTIPKGTVYVDGVEDNGLESYASEQIIFEEPVYFGDVAKEWHEKLLPNKQNK